MRVSDWNSDVCSSDLDAFTPVLELIRQAADDPSVLAIKQTLYRTGKDSAIIEHLVQAARNGKDVTVVVELRARFDEEANLGFADRLQEAGVQVVYGVVGYKTHRSEEHTSELQSLMRIS